MQTIVLHFCYFVLILLFSTAYNTSLIYCFSMFLIWCLHTNKRRPCSSTLSGHPSSSFYPIEITSSSLIAMAIQDRAPLVISWFIIPLTIVISAINHSYMNQLSYHKSAVNPMKSPCSYGFSYDFSYGGTTL